MLNFVGSIFWVMNVTILKAKYIDQTNGSNTLLCSLTAMLVILIIVLLATYLDVLIVHE